MVFRRKDKSKKETTTADVVVVVSNDGETPEDVFERSMILQAQALQQAGDIAANTIIIPSGNILVDDGVQQEVIVSRDAVARNPIRLFRGRPVKRKNLHLPDHILAFKKRRQAGTAAAVGAGGVAGFFVLGPVGVILAASIAYTVTKTIGKVAERRLTLRHIARERREMPDWFTPHATSTSINHRGR